MGPGFRQVHAGMAIAKDEGSRVKSRWGPRVGTLSYGEYQTKKGSATLPHLGRTLQGNGNVPTQGQPSSYD
jgi:hypothetical protein